MAGLPWSWGTTPADEARSLPCDGHLAPPVRVLDRAVDCAAPPAWGYRWLCQVALAPYSYDWIDNRGRRSPRELDPSTEHLEPGRVMATVYELTEVAPGESWTGRLTPSAQRWFGPLEVTYAALPHPSGAPGRCRLVCRMVVPAATRAQRAKAWALAWGDLVMIRKQLHTLAALAARDARRG